MTLEQAAEGIQVWRVTYAGLYAFQRRTIKEANQHKVRFDLPGKIGSSPITSGYLGICRCKGTVSVGYSF